MCVFVLFLLYFGSASNVKINDDADVYSSDNKKFFIIVLYKTM